MAFPLRPKKASTNVSIRADLIQRAKALGLNLSQLFERALEERLDELISAVDLLFTGI